MIPWHKQADFSHLEVNRYAPYDDVDPISCVSIDGILDYLVQL